MQVPHTNIISNSYEVCMSVISKFYIQNFTFYLQSLKSFKLYWWQFSEAYLGSWQTSMTDICRRKTINYFRKNAQSQNLGMVLKPPLIFKIQILQNGLRKWIDYYCTKNEVRVWSHLLKKSFMENFIFCAVLIILVLILFLIFNSTSSNLFSQLAFAFWCITLVLQTLSFPVFFHLF